MLRPRIVTNAHQASARHVEVRLPGWLSTNERARGSIPGGLFIGRAFGRECPPNARVASICQERGWRSADAIAATPVAPLRCRSDMPRPHGSHGTRLATRTSAGSRLRRAWIPPTTAAKNLCQPYGQSESRSLASSRTVFANSMDKVGRMVGGGQPAPMARTGFPTKATHAQTRAHNASLVLRAIYDLGPISRAEIARLTGLTRTIASASWSASSRHEGLAREVGRGPSTGGKAPTLVVARRRRPQRRHPRPRRADVHGRARRPPRRALRAGQHATSTAPTATPRSPSSTS